MGMLGMLGMQDLHNKVLGMVLSSDRAGKINMKTKSSCVACEESMDACSRMLELLFINLLMFLGSSSRRALAIEPWPLILHILLHTCSPAYARACSADSV